jgi:hypothetical protein
MTRPALRRVGRSGVVLGEKIFPAGNRGCDLIVRARHMRKLLFLVVMFAAGYAGLTQYRQASGNNRAVPGVESSGDDAFARARDSGAKGVRLQGQGTVITVLTDDNDGSRHQRFILKLRSGQTLLIAHNIDIAPESHPCGWETASPSTVNMSGTPRAESSTGPITTREDVGPRGG